MHWRFFKRFTVSVILLLTGGLYVIFKFNQENEGLTGPVVAYGESRQLQMKRLADEDLLQTTFGEASTVQFTKHGWLLDILAKNLSKDDAVEALLEEIDRHMPNNFKDNIVSSEPVTAKSTKPSTESLITQQIMLPTEIPKPLIGIQRNLTKRKPPDVIFSGYMNVHVWEAWCGQTVEDLRRNKHFPLYPDYGTTTEDLYVKQRETNFGQRIFGYLHPPATGYYTFCLSSDDNSELWLSNSSDPNHLRKIAYVGNMTHPETTSIAEFHQFVGQISQRIHLTQGMKYYMEILHKQSGFLEHVLVAWKGPGISRTKMITSQYISAYIDEDELDADVNILAEYVPETVASYPTHVHGSFEANHIYRESVSRFGAEDLRDHFHMTPFINESVTAGLLPNCTYSPSYVVDFEVNRYEGVKLIHETAVYPNDQTELTHMIPNTDCENRFIDSHWNILRTTTPAPEISEEDQPSTTVDEIFEEAKTPKSEPFFPNLVSSIKRRFADLKYYVDNYKRILTPTSEPVRGEWAHSVKAKKRQQYRFRAKSRKRRNDTDVSWKQNSLNTGNHIGKKTGSDLGNDASRADMNSNEFAGVEDSFEKHSSKKNMQRNFKKEKNYLLSNRLKRKKQRIGRRKTKLLKINNRIKKIDKKFVKKKEKKSLESEMKLNGRKLLEYRYSSEDSYGENIDGSRSRTSTVKPTFTTMFRTEKENKRRSWLLMTRRPRWPARFYDDEDDETFEIKAGYKKFNITSRRDLIRFIKMYGYSAYQMLEKLPRLHVWKFRQALSECKSDGNLILSSTVATSVVSKYMQLLQKRHGDKYALKKIINVEENHDVANGDRYLIELDLKVKGYGDKSFRLSRYVYQKLGSLELCDPIGMQWNPHANVHVIVPGSFLNETPLRCSKILPFLVKDQGRWVQHFIDNMEKIYLETLDTHLNVIIVDFNSTDINIESSLQRSKLRRYKLIKMDGPFQRALGIQAGVDFVKNPHDIIFTCDLHLDIPASLIDNIRKHCVEGKMAFAPIVVRLECGYTNENPYGLWETQGYGLFAITKSDFDKAGGMNTKEFKTKWGGEDWEMLDRILSSGIEVERLRIPKFYHNFHTKKGMWTH